MRRTLTADARLGRLERAALSTTVGHIGAEVALYQIGREPAWGLGMVVFFLRRRDSP